MGGRERDDALESKTLTHSLLLLSQHNVLFTGDERGGLARGSVFLHVDLRNRVAPVEVTLNPDFLRLASTSPEDVTRRRRREELRAV